jgi:hypothetical protein
LLSGDNLTSAGYGWCSGIFLSPPPVPVGKLY